MNWLDWLIIVVLSLSTLQGLRHGLLIGVAKIAGLLAGLVVAYSYYRPLTDFLSARWHLEEIMLPLIRPFLNFWQPAADVVSPLTVPGKLVSSDYITRLVACSILEALTFLVLLLATVWLVNVAGHILTRVADFSFLGPLNHLGGLFFGFLKGVLVVMVILTLMNLLPGDHLVTPGTAGTGGKAYGNSVLIPYFKPFISIINQALPGIIPRNIILPGQFNSI